MFLPLPLADQIGTALAVAFLIISFIGWLMNANSEKKPPARRPRPVRPPQQGRPPQRQQRVQSEIDNFLAEVSGRSGESREAPPRRQQPRQGQRQARPIRQYEEDPSRSERPSTQDRPRTPRPVQSRSRTPADRDLAELRRRRLAKERKEQEEAQARLRAQQEAAAEEQREREGRMQRLREERKLREQQLRQQADAVSLSRQGGAIPPTALLELLRNPSSVRTAILVNEVLAKPVAMRKK